jgi:hypothetical protein
MAATPRSNPDAAAIFFILKGRFPARAMKE